MKKLKILLLLLTVSVAGFYSCSDNDPVENEIVTTKSVALRTTLNEIKKANNISGRNANTPQDQLFCFQFVYPLTLSYNDGTVVTVTTEAGLLDILTAETETLFITGIAFPFQVQQEGAITTIDDGAEFFALVEGCGFNTINDDVLQFGCFQMVFPISVINSNGTTIVVNTQGELESMLIVGDVVDLVFPFNVTQNNEVIEINSLNELFDLYDECDGNSGSCICTADLILKNQLGAQGKQIQDMCFPILDSLKAGKLVTNVNPMLNSLFRPSVQPYMISWFKHDPQADIKQLKYPSLIIQGDNDLQISLDDARQLSAVRPKSKLVVIEKMDHVLKIVDSGDKSVNVAAYSNPSLPIATELSEAIVGYIKK